MDKSSLNSARKQLWKLRFMLYWRTVVISIISVFLIFWLFSPLFLAVYLSKSPFPYLAYLCVPAFLLNGSFMHRTDVSVTPTADRLLEDRKELIYLIRCEKDNLWAMKRKES